MEIIRFVYLVAYALGIAGVLFILFPRVIMGLNALANKMLADLDKGVFKHERLAGLAMVVLSIMLLLIANAFKTQLFSG